jgi:pimeloyl-ACP methyl ester carboxylesterase
MKIHTPGLFLTLSLLTVISMMTVAENIDGERESQIAQKLVEETVIGKIVWCKTGENSFLTLFTGQPAHQAQGAAIILHGMGAHPDWPDVIAPIRLTLPDRGWSTLSIQLPVLDPEIPVAAYGETVKEAGQRIRAAVKLLRDMEFRNIVIIGHSFGAATAASYIAENKGDGILAFVSIGVRSQKFLNPTLDLMDQIEKINIPVLDVYGSRDFDDIVRSAADRRLAASKNGNHAYRQIEIRDADHNFIGLESALINLIGDWLENVTQNVAVMASDDINEQSEQDDADNDWLDTSQ